MSWGDSPQARAKQEDQNPLQLKIGDRIRPIETPPPPEAVVVRFALSGRPILKWNIQLPVAGQYAETVLKPEDVGNYEKFT